MPTSRAGVINSLVWGRWLKPALQAEACATNGQTIDRGANFSSLGRLQPVCRCTEAGVTLIEMMIVVTLIALVAGITYPSIGSGVDSLRLRSQAGSIASFLNTALDHADRSQQAIEIRILPKENSLIARAADLSFTRRLELPDFVHITSITPAEESAVPGEPRRFLIYPGGTVPGIGVEIANQQGQKRIVSVDPLTGVPRAEPVK